MSKESKHGCTRQGSGAPLKYGEETKSVNFRIPISQLEIVKGLVKNQLSTLTTTHHNNENGKG